MFPKVSKNVFKEKTKKAKVSIFNFRTFLVSVLFIGTSAMADTNTFTAMEVNNLMKEQKKNNFVLEPSKNGLQFLASHRSHSSHASHASHASHRSSSSSYSTPSYSAPSYVTPSYTAPVYTTTYSLTIETVPSNAKVQIMNIKPVYYDGIKLKKGRYDIRVSKAGYMTGDYYVDMTKDSRYSITLNKK